jgi:hypothetical protein
MQSAEAEELITITAKRLGISSLINDQMVREIVQESDGHPYAMKVLLGEIEKAGEPRKLRRVVANRDDVLTALFERTYQSLSPLERRVFLTFAAWNSAVPRVAAEAVILNSVEERVDIEDAIDTIARYSLVEIYTYPKDNQANIRVPLAASIFGQRKLKVDSMKDAVKRDVEFLQMFGPEGRGTHPNGFRPRLLRLLGNVSDKIEKGESLAGFLPVLEMVCTHYTEGWLIFSRWLLEDGSKESLDRAEKAARKFLEHDVDEGDAAEAWRLVANCCYRRGDMLGEVHAFIERSQYQVVPFFDLSNTAYRLNTVLAKGQLHVDPEEKKALAGRLLESMRARRSEANADDLSRMAWLSIHLGDEASASDFVLSGLSLEPDNYHCAKLKSRLGC